METIDEQARVVHGADRYVPGACNIGSEEIRLRRMFGIAGLICTAVAAVALVVVEAPPAARWLVALPLAGSIVSLLQARRRFCVNFALRGLNNFGGRGDVVRIDDAPARSADLRAAARLVVEGGLIALAVTAAFVVLPI